MNASHSIGVRAVAILVMLGLVLAAPKLLSDYNLRVMVVALMSAIAVLGLCVTFGWAGLIQLGQAAFVGIGAYTSTILAMRSGLSFWMTMPVAIVTAAIVAAVIALPMLRLRGHYLALATVGLNVSAEIVAKNWVSLTGGYDGISAIPGITLFGRQLEHDAEYYYLSLAFLIIVALFCSALRRSHFGRAMMAIRDDELAAGTSSVPVFRTKILAFVIGAMLAALSGALLAHYSRYIAPQDFELVRSITLLVMLIVGGEMSIPGAITGAILLSFAPEWLRFVGDAYLAVFGIGVLLVLVLMPEGIAGKFQRLLAVIGKRGVGHA